MAESNVSPKIVVIGSCSVDFITYAPKLPSPGETLHGTKFVTSFGGKGANQCVAAAKLGGNTAMICRLGDDQWGQKYKEHLQDVGVDISNVHITPNTTTGVAQICVAVSGENQIVIVPGANEKLDTDDVLRASELIKTAAVVIGQFETPYESTLAAFKINQGIRLLNAAPARNNINEILPYCSILCVNETEAYLLSNLPVDTIENASISLNKLLEMGCDSVIITLGERGAIYGSKQDTKHVHVMAEQVSPIDTTGAGDAFVGALATFLVTHKNLPMHQIIGAACHVASISVTKEGTHNSYPTNYNAFNKVYNYLEF